MNYIWYYRDLSKLNGICNSCAFMKILCIKCETNLNSMFVYCNIVTVHMYHNNTYVYLIMRMQKQLVRNIYFSNVNVEIKGWFYRISLMLTWRDISFPLNLFLDYEESLLRSVAFLFMPTKLDMNESTNTKIIIASHSQYMKRILSRYACL